MLRSVNLSESVHCETARAYRFLLNPENLPRWAKSFCENVTRMGDQWTVHMPAYGDLRLRFVGRNEFGILDHFLSPAPGVEYFNPMRVVPNDGGTEVLFTLFQHPGISDESFSENAVRLKKDLAELKKLLER